MLTRVMPALLALALLAGCSSSPEPVTLVETKSPVQLLRNEAWFRLPDVMIKTDSETTDHSAACDPGDPLGRMRQWQSSTVALVTNSQAPRVVTAGDNLAASFVEQGWDAERSEQGNVVVTVLTRSTSVARVEIEAVQKTDEHRASIRITASGPCVATEGEGSAELRALEGE